MTYKKIISALFLVTCSTGCMAQGKWVDLFNGKNLSGWQQLNGKAKYDVVKGEIVGTTVFGEPNSFLVTEKSYDDFILELDFRLDADMNSGIQFRSESKPDYKDGRVHGYQMEIDPSARAWTGGIYDEARRGWLYPLAYNPPAQKAYKQKDWNHARIECIGDVIRIWINGIPTAHLIDNLTGSGFIALQVHSIRDEKNAGEQVRWRNIRIQTEKLKPSPLDAVFVVNRVPNTLSQQEIHNGVRLLWDGKSTTNWRGVRGPGFPKQGWNIQDGILTISRPEGAESQRGGDIVTDEMFGAFDLQFEFRLTEGANSGVKYFVTEGIGLEYQILDDEKHPDARQGVVGNRTLASLYDLIPSIKIRRDSPPIGSWNFGRIVVYPDNRVEHWLNGNLVVEYTRGAPAYRALVARSKYAKWEDFGMAERGRILLQDHGDEVSFRSIKIKELK